MLKTVAYFIQKLQSKRHALLKFLSTDNFVFISLEKLAKIDNDKWHKRWTLAMFLLQCVTNPAMEILVTVGSKTILFS